MKRVGSWATVSWQPGRPAPVPLAAECERGHGEMGTGEWEGRVECNNLVRKGLPMAAYLKIPPSVTAGGRHCR
ncbi:unnamed protein product [Protopolystoma xenopodis]|uniref:Uncharacterized protein n=1 Tax=Protopolystoma xenopodis TaxID=117903 RepID=A0A3S5A6A9_9PLAT|nr:unnamed protein product [Protopolystoma xenopodis]